MWARYENLSSNLHRPLSSENLWFPSSSGCSFVSLWSNTQPLISPFSLTEMQLSISTNYYIYRLVSDHNRTAHRLNRTCILIHFHYFLTAVLSLNLHSRAAFGGGSHSYVAVLQVFFFNLND